MVLWWKNTHKNKNHLIHIVSVLLCYQFDLSVDDKVESLNKG